MTAPSDRLSFDDRSVVVVAGVPGAGKTTLIRRAVDRAAVLVVDTDDRREEARRTGTRAPRLLIADHYRRTARAMRSGQPVVIHSRGTHLASRRAITVLAALSRRPAHLVLLDVDRAAAEAGQAARHRVVGPAEMDRQVRRWRRLVAAGTRGRLRGEGWRSITVLDRRQAATIEHLDFPAAVAVPRRRSARLRGRAGRRATAQ